MNREAPGPNPRAEDDPAYPTSSPADPVFPCRTLRPFSPIFDGVATPGVWARLEAPLDSALGDLWRAAGLGARFRPQCWTSIHFGRMALNAHSWELLRSTLRGLPPDPTLVLPPEGRLDALADRSRRIAAPWWRRRVRGCVRVAVRPADEGLSRAAVLTAEQLELPDLARGPLSERSWSQMLSIWLASRLLDSGDATAEDRIARALELESRFARLLGERLVEKGVLQRPAEASYLTVEERLAAVNDPSGPWDAYLSSRIQRVQAFLKVDVPEVFWGAPRVTPD
jgi:hypothetical protein